MPETGKPHGVIAIVRLRSTSAPDELLTALTAGGIRAVEVTADTPEAFATVERWRRQDTALIGVGTVRTEVLARQAIDAGAQFLVTPTIMVPVLQAANEAGVPVVCGALSPTEIDTAWQSGASVVKVFPVDAVGGPAYVRALQGPMPDVPLAPTGGVDAVRAQTYAELGCAGVGVGSALVDEGSVTRAQWDVLQDRAAGFAQAWLAGSGHES